MEEVLPALNYKRVALIEVPILEHEGFESAIYKLNAAWKSYSSTDIDKVLTHSRKALEDIGNILKNIILLCKRPRFDKDGKEFTIDLPDWKKFIDSESKDEIV